MKQLASIGAESTILDVIHGSATVTPSRLNDSPLNLTAFLFGHKRFVWESHIRDDPWAGVPECTGVKVCVLPGAGSGGNAKICPGANQRLKEQSNFLYWWLLMSVRMELTETCFLTNVSMVIMEWSESLFFTPAPVPPKMTPAPVPGLIENVKSDSCLHSENLKTKNRIICCYYRNHILVNFSFSPLCFKG